MAVVKMGQIKSTPAKALAYISRPDATSEGAWVSTNADTIIDATDFKAVARQFAQTAERVGVSKPRAGSVLAHHVIQSFDPKDGIDAATAHRIGTQLAEQITGGSHEYMLATHLDKGHVHNHIIINAVNRETGRKLRVQRGTIGQIRDLSDALCKAEGLRVLPKPERATGRSFADIYRVLKGESAKQFIRTEIDKAAMNSRSWGEFEAALGRAGIEASTRGGRNGTLSFREISMGRPIRDYRLGMAYTESSIMARMSRHVVNQIGVDASMVTRETRDTMTVVVPGTHRELHLTVAKTQVIRRGRSLRLYVPANDEHLLSDRSGNLARTVRTNDLYQWFSQPNLDGVKTKQHEGGLASQWQGRMTELRAMQDRVNAKTRWMRDSGATVDDALTKAQESITQRHWTYQTTLVAVTELMVTPGSDQKEIAALQAQLRLLEREIDTTRSDVQALTQLTKEETKMSVSNRIGAEAMLQKQRLSAEQNQHRREQAQQRTSREVHAADAESTALREDRADERAADALMTDDAEQDRDGGTRSMSLQDRIEMEANKLRENNESRRIRPDGRERGDGRTR